MSLETRKKVHLVFGIVLSVLLVATGIAMMVSCVNIYQNGGDHPFDRAIVMATFDKIAILVYVTVAAVVVGGLFAWLWPVQGGKIKGGMHPQDAISRLWQRVDHSVCDIELLAKLEREIKLRRTLRIIAIAWSVILAVPTVIFVCDLNHFTVESLNDDVIALMCFVLPSAVLALGFGVAVSHLTWGSFQRELALVKEAIKRYPAKEKQSKPVSKDNTKAVWIIRGVIIIVAVVFVVLGIINGGMADVLEKAIKICTECIGLG